MRISSTGFLAVRRAIEFDVEVVAPADVAMPSVELTLSSTEFDEAVAIAASSE